MPLTTRVSVRQDCFEQRKCEYIAVGYVIEGEQPIPINGLCSFVVSKPSAPSTEE